MIRALALAGLVSVSACATSERAEMADEAAIRVVLERQVAAWNRGDIPGFMAGYWRSPDLRFASGGSVTRGWAETLARYEARYDTPEARGVLAFDIIDVTVFSSDDAQVFGAWRLTRDTDAPSGLFTLTFQRIDGAWVITADHTSSAG